jgi:hypothetical protein
LRIRLAKGALIGMKLFHNLQAYQPRGSYRRMICNRYHISMPRVLILPVSRVTGTEWWYCSRLTKEKGKQLEIGVIQALANLLSRQVFLIENRGF